jgi:serine/threonine protein kinase
LENVIVKDDNTLALIDFGHSAPLSEKVEHSCGTKAYFAPEQYL